MRNSRLWQNPLNHLRTFEGDEEICLQWYAWAQAKLKFMLESIPGSTSQMFRPDENVEVTIDTRPSHIYIKATPQIYMESGFYDLRRTELCVEDFYKPALLKYNPYIEQYILGTEKPIQGRLKITPAFEGEQLQNGMESAVVTAEDRILLDKITDSCGHFYSTGGYFSPDDHAVKKKMCQARMPASFFTGKTRLFVQAVYGTQRTDYYCEWESNDFDYTMYISNYHLFPVLDNNTWLLTTPSYDYFMVRYKNETLEFSPLELDGNAKLLKSMMLADPDYDALGEKTRRVEAYVLSHAIIREDLMTTCAIQSPEIIGSPRAYGWHTTWNGCTADMVTLQPDFERNIYQTRHYRMVITPTTTDGVTTFAAYCGIVEGPCDWWPYYAVITFIYPLYVTYGLLPPGMYAVNKVGTVDPVLFSTDYKAPVYVTYGKDDKPLVWKLQKIDLTDPGTGDYGETTEPAEDGDDYIRIGYSGNGQTAVEIAVLKNETKIAFRRPKSYTSLAKYSYTFNSIYTGFECLNGYDWPYGNSIFESKTGMEFIGYMINNGYWADVMGNPVNYSLDGNYKESYYFFCNVAAMNYREERYTAGSEGGAVFLEIPFQDCEQVMTGETSNIPQRTNTWSTKVVGHAFPLDATIYGNRSSYNFDGTWNTTPIGEIETVKFLPWWEAYTTVTGSGATGGVDIEPAHGETIIREGVSEEKMYENLLEGSTNWHFTVIPEDDAPIPLEVWRSNTTKEFSKYAMGWAVKGEPDFPGDSSIGWA